MFEKIRAIGPAVLITSAFIGPGTITVCSLAGYRFGFALLWALIFSVLAAIILQEMCARLGIVTQSGLGETIRATIQNKLAYVFSTLLIISAILIGNGAYEAGNISGAVLGLEAMFPIMSVESFGVTFNFWSLLIGGLAASLLFTGNYKFIERAMIALVLLMSLMFVMTAIAIGPDPGHLMKGLFIPSFPRGSTLLIIALVGTTVVPYNLFLHTSSVSEKWKSTDNLPMARFDTVVSITIGGIISMAVIVTSAGASALLGGGEITNAADLSVQLEPVLGPWARYFMASGLCAAGITSSVTAPLAASYAVTGTLGLKSDLNGAWFKWISGLILMAGILISSLGFKPIAVIQFAQVANGLLLPVVAAYLVWLVNRKKLMGPYINTTMQNVLGIFVILIAVVLGMRSILYVFLD